MIAANVLEIPVQSDRKRYSKTEKISTVSHTKVKIQTPGPVFETLSNTLSDIISLKNYNNRLSGVTKDLMVYNVSLIRHLGNVSLAVCRCARELPPGSVWFNTRAVITRIFKARHILEMLLQKYDMLKLNEMH